jgi:radical SAM superfamily enzyme YgiQ (UPF0313 family)
MVQIFTGRGCPNSCTFCSWPQTFTGKKYRVRSIENLLDELEFIESEMKVKEVFFRGRHIHYKQEEGSGVLQGIQGEEARDKLELQCKSRYFGFRNDEGNEKGELQVFGCWIRIR